MILTLLFIILAISLGVLLTSTFELAFEKTELLAFGIIIGLSVVTFSTYILSITKIGLPILSMIVLTIMSSIVVFTFSKNSKQIKKYSWDKFSLFILISLIIFLAPISLKILINEEKGITTGILNNYGDAGWHVAIITSLSAQKHVPPINPIYADTVMVYPFLSDFLSSILTTLDADIVNSVTLPSLLMLPAIFFAFFVFVKTLTKSKTIALVALIVLIFWGSTFGFLCIGQDWSQNNQSLWNFANHLPRSYYSGDADPESNYHLISPLLSLLLPQRSFMFGLGIALVVMTILIRTTLKNKKAYLIAGILAGILPLFHAHTVLALAPVIIALFFLRPHKNWLYFAIPAIIIGLPQVFYYLTSSYNGANFTWQPGWMKPEQLSWTTYWLINSGFLIPITLYGFFLPKLKKAKALAAIGLMIFLIFNLWLIAKWEWDNTKMFFYWIVLSLPLAISATAHLFKKASLYTRILIVLIICLHLLSSGIDLYQTITPNIHYTIWNKDLINLSKQIELKTNPDDVFVTAPVHNSGIELAGRNRYMGHPGHLWSHGINHFYRQSSLSDFYNGANTNSLDCRVDYVLVGPAERKRYPNLKIQSDWQKKFTVGEYNVYEIVK